VAERLTLVSEDPDDVLDQGLAPNVGAELAFLLEPRDDQRLEPIPGIFVISNTLHRARHGGSRRPVWLNSIWRGKM
jgi:hypothetical protein